MYKYYVVFWTTLITTSKYSGISIELDHPIGAEDINIITENFRKSRGYETATITFFSLLQGGLNGQHI